MKNIQPEHILEKIKNLKDFTPFESNFTHQPEVKEGFKKYEDGEFNNIEDCKNWILKQKATCLRDDGYIEHLNILFYFKTGRFPINQYKDYNNLNEQRNHLQGQLITFKFFSNTPKKEVVLLTTAWGCTNALCHNLTDNKLEWISWACFDDAKKPSVNRIKKDVIRQLI